MAKTRTYTEADINLAREMRAQGSSRRDMAKALGVSNSRLDGLLQQWGLTKSVKIKLSKTRETKFRELWTAGTSLVALGREFGLNTDTIQRLARDFELPARARQIQVTAEHAGHRSSNPRTRWEPIPAMHPDTWRMLWPNGVPEWAGAPN